MILLQGTHIECLSAIFDTELAKIPSALPELALPDEVNGVICDIVVVLHHFVVTLVYLLYDAAAKTLVQLVL
jgi:hypothetical protein